MLKTLLLSAAVGGAGILSAAAQFPSPNVAPTTHCKDKATDRVQLKNNPGNSHSGSINMSGLEDTKGLGNNGSTGISGKEDTTGSFSSTSPSAKSLHDCLKG
jgi:hypothetical protein